MKLEFFEKTMCCATGLCGPSVDKTLVRLQENIEYLSRKYHNLEIRRYQPQTHGLIFRANKEVMELISKYGNKALPITLLDGEVIKYGHYPSLHQLKDAMDR